MLQGELAARRLRSPLGHQSEKWFSREVTNSMSARDRAPVLGSPGGWRLISRLLPCRARCAGSDDLFFDLTFIHKAVLCCIFNLLRGRAASPMRISRCGVESLVGRADTADENSVRSRSLRVTRRRPSLRGASFTPCRRSPRRASFEHLDHLEGGNLHPSHIDDVVLASVQEEKSFLIEQAEVAGFIHSRREAGRAGRIAHDIAWRDHSAGHDHLAHAA